MGNPPHNQSTEIGFADAYVPDLNTTVDETRTVPVTNQETDNNPNEERRDNDPATLPLTTPVDNPATLRRTAHLAAQLHHAAQKPTHTKPLDDNHHAPNKFNATLLSVAPRALAAEGTTFDELPVPEPRAKALLVKAARELKSFRALNDHVSRSDQAAKVFGWTDADDPPSADTFWRAHTHLDEAGYTTAIENAALRAVYALYRNGITLPADIENNYGFDALAPVLEDCPIPSDTRQEALRNWVRVLLPFVEDALTFHRGQNSSYSIQSIIGLFAHSALQNAGLKNSARTAAWLYNPAQIPGGSGVWDQVRDLSVSEIDAQFTAANAGLIQYAAGRGLFDDEPNLAFDKTGIGWSGKDNELTVKRPQKKHIDAEWIFAAMSVMDVAARLTLGIRFVKTKTRTVGKLRELLAFATDQLDPGRVYSDREFHDGNAIRALRDHVGRDWVTHAKIQNDIKDIVRQTPRGEYNFREDIGDFVTPRPNVIVIPDDHTNQVTGLDAFSKTVNDDADGVGAKGTHEAFLTDLTPDDTTGRGIDFEYNDRWNIETFMRQMKYDVLPVSESSRMEPRLYAANIAVVVFNIHTIVNRLPSPEYGLPLDATHQEVLTAIRDVAFTTDQ